METLHLPDNSRAPQDWLSQEYLSKKARNPAYSLRAFSRFLGVPSGRMSEWLSGKRPLNPHLVTRFSEKLKMNTEVRDSWLQSLEHQRQKRTRFSSLSRLAQDRAESDAEYYALSEEVFKFISGWQHLALLNLMRTNDFKSQPEWMARRLGISKEEVLQALERLERLNLIRHEGGKYSRRKTKFKTTDNIPSQAIRDAHQQILGIAASTLHHVNVQERDFSTMMMAISPDKLPTAKKLIRNFRRNLAELMEEGPKTEVYSLCIALFPLSSRTYRGTQCNS